MAPTTVDNLLSNALKFTPAGGNVELTLSVETDTAIGRDAKPEFCRFCQQFLEQHEPGERTPAPSP